MTQHFTKNTVSASFWCPKCKKFTQWSISHGRKGSCLECIERLNREHDARQAKTPEPKQENLF